MSFSVYNTCVIFYNKVYKYSLVEVFILSVPVVAIVGRPNVGKSALFNKLVGKKIAITSGIAGTTRDSLEGVVTWQNKKFKLLDTGGLNSAGQENSDIYHFVKKQALGGIRVSNLIVFVVDVRQGLNRADEEIAMLLKKSQKPVVLCVNKCDAIGASNLGVYEFYSLGFGDPLAISATHGHGTGDLLDKICNLIDFSENDTANLNINSIKVAVVGKPNAGKSTLINKIINKDRCIVTDIPGTTRDSLDIFLENSFGSYTFIDTAGIRKRKKISEEIEKYSVLRSKMAIERSNVCLLLVDITQGYSEQDSKIVEEIVKAGKGCIIVANKWDAVEKDTYTMKIYEKNVLSDFSFIKYAPLIFISAKTGQKVSDIFNVINSVYESCNLRIPTGKLNNFLENVTAKVPPPTHKGKRLKIFYVTQASVAPPNFVFFVNSESLFHFSYRRYIENQLREAFHIVGTPIKFLVREKNSYKNRNS